MAEILNIRLVDTQEKRTIEDAEPLESAKLFWAVSDAIWQQNPTGDDSFSASFAIEAAAPAAEAALVLNEVFEGIDEKLVVIGREEPLELDGMRGPDTGTTVPSTILAAPQRASIGTFKWDARATSRLVYIDGQQRGASFTDGHTDRHREVFASFRFRSEGSVMALQYAMQRMQPWQDDTTALSMILRHSAFAETGYEGHHLAYVPVTEEQEIALLEAFQAIGGLVLEMPS